MRSMALQRRLATLLLALVGAVSVHWVVYSALQTNSIGHGYLPVASSLVLPAGLVSLCWFSVRSARNAFVGHELSTPVLAAGISGLFVGQELIEQLSTVGTASFDLAFLLGALVALPAAALLRRLVSTVAEIVREFLQKPVQVFGTVAVLTHAVGADVVPRRVECTPLVGRAPPLLV